MLSSFLISSGDHRSHEADARTQIGKSLAMKPLQAGIPGLDKALGRRGRLVGTWDLAPVSGLFPLQVAQLPTSPERPRPSRILKPSAAPQTPNAPNAPDAIQLKFGLSDLTVDRLKRMTGPRDPISPDTYPK